MLAFRLTPSDPSQRGEAGCKLIFLSFSFRGCFLGLFFFFFFCFRPSTTPWLTGCITDVFPPASFGVAGTVNRTICCSKCSVQVTWTLSSADSSARLVPPLRALSRSLSLSLSVSLSLLLRPYTHPASSFPVFGAGCCLSFARCPSNRPHNHRLFLDGSCRCRCDPTLLPISFPIVPQSLVDVGSSPTHHHLSCRVVFVVVVPRLPILYQLSLAISDLVIALVRYHHRSFDIDIDIDTIHRPALSGASSHLFATTTLSCLLDSLSSAQFLPILIVVVG